MEAIFYPLVSKLNENGPKYAAIFSLLDPDPQHWLRPWVGLKINLVFTGQERKDQPEARNLLQRMKALEN